MVVSAFAEVCGGLMFSFTRSVAEHFSLNETETDFEAFGYNPVEHTGLEWNHYPVDELVYQEYGQAPQSEIMTYGYNVRPRLINACLPEEDENTTEENADRAMAWKRHRPSFCCTIWNSLYLGFLISVLSAVIIATFSIFVYYVNYQAILICLARPQESIPIKIQWFKTISEAIALAFSHFWFLINFLFYFRPYQIKRLKRKLFLISFVFYVPNVFYRVVLQACGIYFSVLTHAIKIPGNALFAVGNGAQSWVVAKHFATAAVMKKLKLFLWLVILCVVTLVLGIMITYFIYPEYNRQNTRGKFYIAVFFPLITVVLKGVSRLCLQRLWRISHPGTSFVLLVPLYYGSSLMLRLLQVDLRSLESVAFIGMIHGSAEVIERSTVVLADYIYYQIYQRKRVAWGNFRSPRRERLATDIAIMSMLYEASAIISVNGFLHLHEYYYTADKTPLLLLKSFVITTAVPLAIEWFFSSVSIAIETRYQNRPVMAVWRRHWKRHLVVALINSLPIAVWSCSSLLIVLEGKFANVKDYCAMPFTHP